MKLGIITDIHNNIYALKSVLNELNEMQCNKIICCGDIIGIGPCPEETVNEIMNIPNLICVSGNHECYLTDGISRDYLPEMDISEIEHHLWEHNLLSEKSKEFIFSLPASVDFTVNNYKIHVTHYALDKNEKCLCIAPKPTTLDLQRMFEDVDADIILFGHDHFSTISNTQKKYYINCGSLGCPLGDNIARAGILNITDKINFEKIEVKYDKSEVIDKINELKYPACKQIKKIFYGIKSE